jgi:hypothetical protein
LVALIINFHSTRLRTPNICGAPLKENHHEKYFSARSARRNGGRRGSAAAITDASPASAQAGAKPIFPVPATTIPIVGETDVFRVRRIYCIGRNYAAHAIERATVLLPEADRRDPKCRDRGGRRSSLSFAHQELSSRG